MEKRGGETNILKRAGKLGQGVGVLKRRGGTRTPSQTMCCYTPYGNIINSLLYGMFRRKSCDFIKVSMLEENVT